MSRADLLVPSAELMSRIRKAECGYTWSRMGVLEALPGNPVGVKRRRIGEAWGFLARYLPMPSFNRVVGLTDDQADEIPHLVEWFRQGGAQGRFELTPDGAMDRLSVALTAAGYAHTGFHATLHGPAEAATAAIPSGVEVERVTTPEALETFLDVYGAGWGVPDIAGFKANVRGWLNEPNWSLYLARLNGKPAGEAILYMSEGVGYLADSSVTPACRGHGVHRALIDRRRDDALAAGAEVVCVQAAYLSTSHRNMVRAGLSLLYAQALWTPKA